MCKRVINGHQLTNSRPRSITSIPRWLSNIPKLSLSLQNLFLRHGTLWPDPYPFSLLQLLPLILISEVSFVGRLPLEGALGPVRCFASYCKGPAWLPTPSYCCICAKYHKIGYKPFNSLAKDPNYWDFPLWVWLTHHLIKGDSTQIIQGYKEIGGGRLL